MQTKNEGPGGRYWVALKFTVIVGILFWGYWQAVEPIVLQAVAVLQSDQSPLARVGAAVAVSFLAGVAVYMAAKSWQWLGRLEAWIFARRQDAR